jgi:hypothetical protein
VYAEEATYVRERYMISVFVLWLLIVFIEVLFQGRVYEMLDWY